MASWRDRKTKLWRYEFHHEGKRISMRGFRTKAEAKAAEAAHRKELKSSPSKPTPNVIGFKEVASAYLDYAERRFAKLTYQYKAFVCRSFLTHHGDAPIAQITPHEIHQYLSTRPSNHNYNAHRKDLSTIFNWARRQLALEIQNPCAMLDKLPHTPPRKRILSEEEVLRLIMASDPIEERPLILVILLTLARVDEILRLRWEDVNFSTNTITLYTRKRKDGSYHGDTLPMPEPLVEILRQLWDRRVQEEWVFFNAKTGTRYNRRPKLMPGLCRRAGIDPPVGFHHLRHTGATYMADQLKISKKTISGLLRHQSLATTEIYLGSVDESQRKAMLEYGSAWRDLWRDFDQKRPEKVPPHGKSSS